MLFNDPPLSQKERQKIVIYYNCIGAISIPEEVPVPNVEVTLGTRQGVELKYISA